MPAGRIPSGSAEIGILPVVHISPNLPCMRCDQQNEEKQNALQLEDLLDAYNDFRCY
jgi:hypothetical protein